MGDWRIGKNVISALFVAVLLAAGACSSKSPGINACSLLTKAEVGLLSAGIEGHDYFPEAGDKPDACVWHDGANRNLVMIFFYHSAQNDPMDLVTRGMQGRESRITAIIGVGSAAAAAFAPSPDDPGTEEMRLFAAGNEEGVIGIRARNVGDEDSPEFATVIGLAKTALSRIE